MSMPAAYAKRPVAPVAATEFSFEVIKVKYKNGRPMDEFLLSGNEYVELKNLLKLMGWCASGGEAMTVIAQRQVRVDGAVELRKRCKIRTGQTVAFAGHTIIVK